jgi:hypothetical protein
VQEEHGWVGPERFKGGKGFFQPGVRPGLPDAAGPQKREELAFPARKTGFAGHRKQAKGFAPEVQGDAATETVADHCGEGILFQFRGKRAGAISGER